MCFFTTVHCDKLPHSKINQIFDTIYFVNTSKILLISCKLKEKLFTKSHYISRRQSDRYYDNTFLDQEVEEIGLENTRTPDYVYTDKPKTTISEPVRTNSATTITTNSAVSLKEVQDYNTSTPIEEHKKTAHLVTSKKMSKSRTQLIQGVPQTDV